LQTEEGKLKNKSSIYAMSDWIYHIINSSDWKPTKNLFLWITEIAFEYGNVFLCWCQDMCVGFMLILSLPPVVKAEAVHGSIEVKGVADSAG